MKKLKVVGYARVSTDSEEQKTSYNHQQQYFRDEITTKGHIFYGIYADKGLTGTKLNNRPQFNQMLYDAGIDIINLNSNKNDVRNSKKHTVYEISDREPKFDYIWISNTSRFARNTLSFELIHKLRQKEVYIYFIQQGIDTKDIANDVLLKILQVLDENESKDKSEKVKGGIEQSAKNNVIKTNHRLYGYKYIPLPENRLVIIPEEAEVIKKIYELYSEGYGFRRIINYLTENNIFTRQGKKFAQNTIRSILRNEKYYGGNPILKYDSGEVFNKKSPTIKDEYQINENDRIEPIITKELFDKCQQQREDNTSENNKGVYKGYTKYSGMLICGKCHENYVSNVDRGRQFYNCRTKKMQGKIACDNENISVTKLESLISADEYNEKVSYLKSNLIKAFENCISDIEIKRNKDFESETFELRTEKQTLNDNIKNLLKQSAIATSDNVRNIIDDELTNISNRIKLIDTEIDKLSNWDFYIDNQVSEIKETIQELNNIVIKDNYTEDELFEQIHKIVVNDANNIIIHYNIENRIMELLEKYDIQNNKHLMFYKDFFHKIFNK